MSGFLNTGMALVLVSLFLFMIVLLGTLFGALAGWIVGLFFTDTILGIFSALGVQDFAMWQIGAFLGFVGGFFKSSDTNKN